MTKPNSTHGLEGADCARPKWTPGPWRPMHERVVSLVTYDTVAAITQEVNRAWTIQSPETERANARLIASAPCLYDALTELRNVGNNMAARKAARAKADAALSKARGEQA